MGEGHDFDFDWEGEGHKIFWKKLKIPLFELPCTHLP